MFAALPPANECANLDWHEHNLSMGQRLMWRLTWERNLELERCERFEELFLAKIDDGRSELEVIG